jgi:hypothetical protein
MKFGELKNLNYPDCMEVEQVLADLFYNGQVSFLSAAVAYSNSLERDRHDKESLFNEAACVITMALSGNWKGKYKEQLVKRAIHILNLNKTFPSNIYNDQYGYTSEDKKEWDEFMKMHYDYQEKEK